MSELRQRSLWTDWATLRKGECVMEMSKMLTLSTSHVSKETGEWLNEQGLVTAKAFLPDSTDSCPIHMGPHTYGWFVHVPDKDGFDDIFPSDLRTVIEFARKRDVGYLNFDADSYEVDELPQFAW